MLELGIHPMKSNILVACSGGIDSTVLVHALFSSGFKIQVAHVNYKLRGAESDENQHFVTEMCSSLKIPLHVIAFDTKTILDSQNINLQELARDLRYNWFKELLEKHQLDYVATAHHAEDQAETILHHFIRGSGLKGLSGIAHKKDQIIRPLLSFKKDEIIKICLTQQWNYSGDSSNEKNDYTRNFIRNQIMPLLRVINPGITETLNNHGELYHKMNAFVQWSAQKCLQDLKVQEDEFSTDLNINDLITIPGYQTILYEFLRPAGFNNDQIQQVSSAVVTHKRGFLLQSETHKILVDRSTLKLSLMDTETNKDKILWETHHERLTLPDGTIINKSSAYPENIPEKNRINVDIQWRTKKLYFRHWKHGDIFYPAGMNGQRKKVSDYFIDSKLNRFEKNRVWLLVNEMDEIIWISGMRADHRFIPESAEASYWIYIE